MLIPKHMCWSALATLVIASTSAADIAGADGMVFVPRVPTIFSHTGQDPAPKPRSAWMDPADDSLLLVPDRPLAPPPIVLDDALWDAADRERRPIPPPPMAPNPNLDGSARVAPVEAGIPEHSVPGPSALLLLALAARRRRR